MRRLLCVLITLTICMAAVTFPASAATESYVNPWNSITSTSHSSTNSLASFSASLQSDSSVRCAFNYSSSSDPDTGTINFDSDLVVPEFDSVTARVQFIATSNSGRVSPENVNFRFYFYIPGLGRLGGTFTGSTGTVTGSLSLSSSVSATSFYATVRPTVSSGSWGGTVTFNLLLDFVTTDPPSPLPTPDSGTPQFAIPFNLSGDATQLPDARQYVNAIFQQAIVNKWWSFAEYPYYTITHWYVEGAPYQYLVIVLSHDPYEGTVSLQTGGALQFDEWQAQGSEMIYVLPYLADDPSTLLSGTLYYSMWYYPHWNWLDYVNGRVSDWMGGYSGSGECIAGARVRTATVNTTGPLSFYGISNYLVYDSIPVDGQYMSNSGWFSSTQIPEAYMDLVALWVGSGSSNSVDHAEIIEKLTSIDGNVKDIEDILNASSSYSSDATTAIKDAAASAGEFLENNADMSLVINDLSTHKPVIDDLFSQFFAAMGLEATIILSLMVLGVIGILLQRR